MNLTEILDKNNIFTSVDYNNRNDILKFGAKKISDLSKNKFSSTDIYNKLLEREQIMSTGIGENFAIPHIKLSDLNNYIMIVISPKNPVNFNSFDNQKVKFLIIWASSNINADINLQILSAISAIFKFDIDLIDKIFHSKTNNDIFNLIKNKEKEIIIK